MRAIQSRLRKLEKRGLDPSVVGAAIREYAATGSLPPKRRLAECVRDYWARVDELFAEQDKLAEGTVHDP